MWDARLGQNRLAAPGSYAVRWPDQKGIEARAFVLLPDPQLADADAGAATSTTNNAR